MLKRFFSVRMSLFGKFFVSSVALLVILSVIVSATMNVVINNLLSDEIIKYHTNCLKKLDSNLTYITEKIEHLASNMVFPAEISEFDNLSSYHKQVVSKEVTEQLNNAMIYSNILGIRLIVDGKSFVTGQYYGNDALLNENVWPGNFEFYSDKDYDASYITFLKRVHIGDNDGLMIILISPMIFAESFEGVGLFALDSNSEVLWVENMDIKSAEVFSGHVKKAGMVEEFKDVKLENGKRYILMKSGTGQANFVMCLDNNVLGKAADEIRTYGIALAVGVILLCVILSFIMSRIITTRINLLKNKMQNFELHTRIEENAGMGIGLRKKIIMYYVIACFLPIVLMTMFYYSLSVTKMEEEVFRAFEQSVGYVGDNMLMTTDGYVIDSRYIANDEYVQELLLGSAKADEEKINAVIDMAAGETGCENIILYNSDGKVIYSLKNGGSNELEKGTNNILWLEPHYDEYNQKVSGFVIPINGNDFRRSKYMHCIGYLKFIFKESVLKDIISLTESEGANVFLLNMEDKVIVSENVSDIGKDMDDIIDGERIVCEYTVNNSWKIRGVMQPELLFKNKRMILLYCFLVFAVVLFLLIIFSNQICSIIVTPVKVLNSHIRDNMVNRAKSRINLKTGDEIEELCKSFNIMNDEIDRLINDVYEAELAKKKLDVEHKEASLNALQAQINPHFLYNTFETANWLIIEGKTEAARRMINLLSDMFRLGINRGNNTLILSREIHHARSYIDIQQMRYADKLSVFWEYDDSILNCVVTKTIIQPILENAIYHGIEPKEDGGEIEVSIDRIGDELEIRVLDSGVGIEKEKCDMINNDLKNNENKCLKNIGLKNVNDRIKLMYGEGYGVRVESVYGKYTEVILTLPYLENMEEGGNI